MATVLFIRALAGISVTGYRNLIIGSTKTVEGQLPKVTKIFDKLYFAGLENPYCGQICLLEKQGFRPATQSELLKAALVDPIAAEAGATERQLMAIFGWKDPALARRYTEKVNREKMTSDSIHMIRGRTKKE